jgi:hypothetical protein
MFICVKNVVNIGHELKVMNMGIEACLWYSVHTYIFPFGIYQKHYGAQVFYFRARVQVRSPNSRVLLVITRSKRCIRCLKYWHSLTTPQPEKRPAGMLKCLEGNTGQCRALEKHALAVIQSAQSWIQHASGTVLSQDESCDGSVVNI